MNTPVSFEIDKLLLSKNIDMPVNYEIGKTNTINLSYKIKNMNTKFKLLIIKSSNSLEDDINEFIKDKEIISLQVQYMVGSLYSTHQVYIHYKDIEK